MTRIGCISGSGNDVDIYMCDAENASVHSGDTMRARLRMENRDSGGTEPRE